MRDAVDRPGSAVDHPAHYHATSSVEVIDAIEAWDLGFSLGNAVKYIARAMHKDSPITDLKKARWYLDREIARLTEAVDSTRAVLNRALNKHMMNASFVSFEAALKEERGQQPKVRDRTEEDLSEEGP